MLLKHLIIATLGSSLFLSCTAQNNTSSVTSSATAQASSTSNPTSIKMIYLNKNEPKFFENLQANLTFKEVTEDSRCPEGVNCVWEGMAKVKLEIMGTYTRPMHMELATIKNSAEVPTSTEFNGYKITLKEVHPYPKKDKKADPNVVSKIGILIEKI